MKNKKMYLAALVCTLALVFWPGGAGAQDNEAPLTILMASPGEGEIFYIAPESVVTSVPISGQVVCYEAPLRPETVTVDIELVDAGGSITEASTTLDESGHFMLWVMITPPDYSVAAIEPHETDMCGYCHRISEVSMPAQVTHVNVYARAADGRSGSVTRRLSLHKGVKRALPVEVEGLPEDAADAQVVAVTDVYNFRQRTFYATLGQEGKTEIMVEVLPDYAMHYEISLAPFLHEQTLYTAPSQTLVLRRDEPLPSVNLVAAPTRGTIEGQVVLGMGAQAEVVEASVIAVDLATGASQTTTTDTEGFFELQDLSIAEHALLARAPEGFHLPQRLDLHEAHNVETRIHLTRAGIGALAGRVMFEGRPMHFAQVETEGLPPAQADPISGRFMLAGVEQGAEVAVTGAGCYGVRIEDAAEDLGEITLSLHADTQVIALGGGRLYVPSQTDLIADAEMYTLRRGVVWARDTGEALRLLVDDYVLEGDASDFAVEKHAEIVSRLYVSRGMVRVTRGSESVQVEAGQTLALHDDVAKMVRPVVLSPEAGAVLRTVAGPVVSSFEPAPAFSERFASASLDALVKVAQGTMLLAFLITFVLMPVALVGTAAMFVYYRRRDRQAATE